MELQEKPLQSRYPVDRFERRFVTGETFDNKIRQGVLVHETEEYGVVVGMEATYLCSRYATVEKSSLFGDALKLAKLLKIT